MLLRVGKAGDGAGDSAGLVAEDRHARDDVAFGVEIHVAGSRGGGLLAVVKEVGFAVLVADEHEAASAEVAGEGVDDGEGEVHGDGGVDGVAALLEDLDASVSRVVLDGDDHGVRGAGWFDVGLLGKCGDGDKRDAGCDCSDAGCRDTGGYQAQGLLQELG